LHNKPKCYLIGDEKLKKMSESRIIADSILQDM